LAVDLVRLLGSSPLFTDAVEVDSLMAATHTLPQLLAACLLNATVDQPGWREGRKLAGKAYAEVTSSIAQLGSPEMLSNSAVLAQEHMVRIINNLIVLLQIYRDDIQNKDTKSLTEKLERARKGREDWWNQRKTSHWTGEEVVNVSELPKSSDFFARLVGLSGRKEKPKK
jgi:prephenate dehydrogenase